MIKNLTGGGRRGRTSPHTLQEQVDPYKVEVAKKLNLYFKENPSAKVPNEKELQKWATPTTSQLEQNESLDSYLRRSKKRFDKGKTPFPTQLTFEIEAEETGVNIKEEIKSWATPTASDYRKRGPNSKQQGINNQVIDEEKKK